MKALWGIIAFLVCCGICNIFGAHHWGYLVGSIVVGFIVSFALGGVSIHGSSDGGSIDKR